MWKVPWICVACICMAQYGGSISKVLAEGKCQEMQSREFNIENPFQRPENIVRSNGRR